VLHRYVVVSLGSIGRRHLANLRVLRPNAQIAVCRLSQAARDEPAPEHADLVIYSIDEVLSFAPSAAIIAGPASTHVPVAIALAQSGTHLFIEKPLSDCLNSANELLNIVTKSGVVATVGYNLRFMTGLREAKRIIDDGRIGRVLSVRAAVGQYLPDWRPDQDYRRTVSAQSKLGGGALLELSHEIDYLIWIFGIPDVVVAQGGRFSDLEIDVEDLVEFSLNYDSPRRLVSVHLDLLDRAGFRELRVIGTDGTLRWDALQDSVTVFDPSSREWNMVERLETIDRNDVYISELQHFLECAESGSAPDVDIQQGRDVLRVIDAVKDSLNEKRAVSIEKTKHCDAVPTDENN
jgi:predicted dehydrogenase